MVDASCSKCNVVKPRKKVCHHCGKGGHIRPHCYKLLNEPKQRKVRPVPAPVATTTATASATVEKVLHKKSRAI